MAKSAATTLKEMLAERIRRHRKQLVDWHLEHARRAPPPFYCSVDLRDAGFKIAPVDSNLYPAGFNNICPEDLRSAPPIVRAQLDAFATRLGRPVPERVLILPEAHTTNAHYFENLYYLGKLLGDAGYDVRFGWFGAVPVVGKDPDGTFVFRSATGKEVRMRLLEIRGGVAQAGDFVPDIILLNNDFSSGYPRALDAVAQPILPSHVLGWHSRKKSGHFRHYNRLAGEFAAIIGVDPWLLQIDTEEVDRVNFNEGEGLERVEQAAAQMLERARTEYERRGIKRAPFVFVKNNAGTYGMGILVVRSPEELAKLNRRAKNKMSVGKNRLPIESVAVQEGVPTATLVDRLPAEPVIYLAGCELIGGFLRANSERGERGDEENLNAQGMAFRKLCMSDLKAPDDELGTEPALELVYGSVARISALATGKELEDAWETADAAPPVA